MCFVSEFTEVLLLFEIHLSAAVIMSGFHAFQTDLAFTMWTLDLTLVISLVSLNQKL